MGLCSFRQQNPLRGIKHVGRLSFQGSVPVYSARFKQRELLHLFQYKIMNSDPLTDLSRLCIHSITTKPWNIEEAAENFSKNGVKGITVWRDALNGRNIRRTGEMLRTKGLSVVSLCRGGFFPSA